MPSPSPSGSSLDWALSVGPMPPTTMGYRRSRRLSSSLFPQIKFHQFGSLRLDLILAGSERTSSYSNVASRLVIGIVPAVSENMLKENVLPEVDASRRD
jgi:hypothetical protein